MSQAKRQLNAKIYLDWTLQRVMEMHPRMPALGGGMVLNGELVYAGVRGVRRVGNSSAATIDDRFQLGSITKPLTGYLIAVLKKQGKINWTQTIGQTWPDLISALPAALGNAGGRDEWVAHYRDTTLAALMTHSSGFDYQPSTETEALLAVASSTPGAQLPAKRKIYARLALLDRPYQGWKTMKDGGAPPAKYSGGCIVAAAMAEQLTGSSWEMLMAQHVFVPLGMTRYTFVNASSKTSVTDLWQHSISNGQVVGRAIPEETQISYTHGPAGAVSLSLPSWGQWAKSLLRVSDDAHMTMTPLNEYFTLPGADFNCTRGGWFGGSGRFAHDGCNFWNYASMLVDRPRRMATLAATNIHYDGITSGIFALREEMERLADAWPAMEHLSESLALAELSCTASSSAGDHPPELLTDSWFRTYWAASVKTPTLTVTLQEERLLKGLALCEYEQSRITAFELEVRTAVSGGMAATFSGSTLEAMTTREGLVTKVLFPRPVRAKTLVLRVRAASDAPQLSRLMVMTYESSRPRSFDISNSGALWITDHAERVLTTTDGLLDEPVVMDRDTGGVAKLVRRAAGKIWAIGSDGKLWRCESDGWYPVGGSPVLLRIAVDAQNDAVWCVDSSNVVRRYINGIWFVPPGTGLGKDICVHGGQAWIVGMNDVAHASTASGWTAVPQNPAPLRRIAVDDSNLRLWALSTTDRIYSRTAGAIVWMEHAGDGRGKEISVHGGLPYVIGVDAGIWRSAGSAGWTRLPVLQARG